MAMTASFESALQGRVDAMIDACTRCGKCVEVCPATEPAGLSAEQRQNPAEVVGGVIDLLRGSAGNDAARKWASGCLLSGECIKACGYGVNPRFLLGMARVATRFPNTMRRGSCPISCSIPAATCSRRRTSRS